MGRGGGVATWPERREGGGMATWPERGEERERVWLHFSGQDNTE